MASHTILRGCRAATPRPTMHTHERSILRALAITSLALGAACGSSEPTGTTGGGSTKLSTPTCGPTAVVTLGANQASTVACSSGTFVNLAGGAKYLIVPQ